MERGRCPAPLHRALQGSRLKFRAMALRDDPAAAGVAAGPPPRAREVTRERVSWFTLGAVAWSSGQEPAPTLGLRRELDWAGRRPPAAWGGGLRGAWEGCERGGADGPSPAPDLAFRARSPAHLPAPLSGPRPAGRGRAASPLRAPRCFGGRGPGALTWCACPGR